MHPTSKHDLCALTSVVVTCASHEPSHYVHSQPRHFAAPASTSLCIALMCALLRLCLVCAHPECAAGCLVAHAHRHARLPAPPRQPHVCWMRPRHGRRMRSEALCHRRRRLCGLRRRLAPAGGGAVGRAHRGGAVRWRRAGRRRIRRGCRPAAPLHAARAGAPAPDAGWAGLLMLQVGRGVQACSCSGYPCLWAGLPLCVLGGPQV